MRNVGSPIYFPARPKLDGQVAAQLLVRNLSVRTERRNKTSQFKRSHNTSKLTSNLQRCYKISTIKSFKRWHNSKSTNKPATLQTTSTHSTFNPFNIQPILDHARPPSK
jgi:hypothetical protein